jgi:hypothetical protein
MWQSGGDDRGGTLLAARCFGSAARSVVRYFSKSKGISRSVPMLSLFSFCNTERNTATNRNVID